MEGQLLLQLLWVGDGYPLLLRLAKCHFVCRRSLAQELGGGGRGRGRRKIGDRREGSMLRFFFNLLDLTDPHPHENTHFTVFHSSAPLYEHIIP